MSSSPQQVVRRRALIVVDMSVEQMSAVRFQADTVVRNCRRLALSQVFDLRIDSKLWLKSPQESSLSKVWPETGKTMFVADSEGACLIPDLRDLTAVWKFVPKNNYSCFANSDLLSILKANNITDVYLAGINTDYCVFATALDSFQANLWDTYVVQDAVTSVRGQEAHEEGLRNLERHFSDSVLVTTDEVLSLEGKQK